MATNWNKFLTAGRFFYPPWQTHWDYYIT